MVRDVWHSVLVEGTPLERWQAKIRRLRQCLRGWAKNVSGAYKKEKRYFPINLMSWIKRQKIFA
jgi:hypothetical protein